MRTNALAAIACYASANLPNKYRNNRGNREFAAALAGRESRQLKPEICFGRAPGVGDENPDISFFRVPELPKIPAVRSVAALSITPANPDRHAVPFAELARQVATHLEYSEPFSSSPFRISAQGHRSCPLSLISGNATPFRSAAAP
jgi:hypothetical protein